MQKKIIVLLFFICFILACTDNVKQYGEANVDKIILSADKSTISADGEDLVNFAVKVYDKDGNEIEKDVRIYINNTAQSIPYFSTYTPGVYNVYAVAEGVESNVIQIEAISNKLYDIDLQNTEKKGIIVLNKNGKAEYNIESIGNIYDDFKSSASASKSSIPYKQKIPKKDKKIKFRGDYERYQNRRLVEKRIDENTEQHNFLVYDLGSYYTVTSEKVYGNSESHCLIFVEESSQTINTINWNLIGQYFDNNIYPKMSAMFGDVSDIDGNNKVVIFYSDLGTDYFGYFDPNDYTDGNNMEILYMNSELSDYGYPPNSEEMLSTLTHEFQHMISFGTRLEAGKKILDAWLDEALSVSAEHYVSNSAREIYVDVMQEDAKSKIRNGYPLTYFNYNDDGESYSMSYTFMQYCKNQYSGREALFREIIEHEHSDYRAVEDIMTADESRFHNFGDIIAYYKIANMINDSGIYGYGNDKDKFDFTNSDVILPPDEKFIGYISGGAAVYYSTEETYLEQFQPSGEGENIIYYRIR